MSRAASPELWDDAELWTVPSRGRAAAADAQPRREAVHDTEDWRLVTPPPGTRRTVVIRGQVAPPRRVTDRRRPARRPHERLGARPDRAAQWAVLMGLFLIVVAAMTGHVL
ncbi:MAG: hypothetical protein JWN32_3557 [Solirubrobacterales bacterium]|jgi:hypothetical protein|nr:hypothetical protein [Solirubrobacterales bacterium]